MNNNREYIYSFPNATSTLRIVKFLRNQHRSYLDSVAVINLIDRWLIKLSLKNFIPDQLAQNIQAFLDEMGIPAQPSGKILDALESLEQGVSPTVVMNRYQVVIVVHGKPETEEIEIFRDHIVDRLGYCPKNMA